MYIYLTALRDPPWALLIVDCWLLIVNCWLLIVDCWLLTVDCWLLIVDCWMLIVDCCLLNVGCWLLTIVLAHFWGVWWCNKCIQARSCLHAVGGNNCIQAQARNSTGKGGPGSKFPGISRRSQIVSRDPISKGGDPLRAKFRSISAKFWRV